MKLEFLKRENSSKLLLIFAGWSTGPALYMDINQEGWDSALVWGTDNSAPDFSSLYAYDTIYLYAWSFGVFFAEKFLPSNLRLSAAYAIAGTPTPCDDAEGIPCAVFRGTASTLSERNLQKFQLRMAGSKEAYEFNKERLGLPYSPELSGQLEWVASHSIESHIDWTAAYITLEDRIFPAQNQKSAWGDRCKVVDISSPHLVDIKGIISSTVIDLGKVRRQFSRSMATYSPHAHAQRLIAGHLNSYLQSRNPLDCERVIEIGPGTGLFTNEWKKSIHPKEAYFMDLCEMPDYNAAPVQHFLQGDAEAEITEMANSRSENQLVGKVDAIISASAIQWFADPERFFINAYRLLKPGGILAVSTFSPGNLPELHGLRHDPMCYPSAEKIKIFLRDYNEVKIIEEKVEIDFTTPLEALRHLRLTGVTGSGASATASALKRFASQYPQNSRGRFSLTFKPLYILASKPKG